MSLAFHTRWPKYWSFNFCISPSNEYSGLISFRIDWLDLLQSKGLSGVFSNSTFQKHQFFSAQLSLWSNSHIHTYYWKNHSFDYMDLNPDYSLEGLMLKLKLQYFGHLR